MDDRLAPTRPAAERDRTVREACGIVLGDRFMCVRCATSALGRGFWPPTARFVAAPGAAVCGACGQCAVPALDGDDGNAGPCHVGAPAEVPTFRATGDDGGPGGSDGDGSRAPPAPARRYTCTFM
ncbi:hypothetical protein pdul_cds_185 [Pandoravirus dulcis]|uniref:Uncharacterized protein n=1 Tax=Pandoravirus dulcis TaxID=1349409 RepID=S4VP97_9VIRU|nr:hypothetical protein pdul_cds_185 [Pandoravirus dulcis]AGO82113.1 hypothetical protein pdul_cds_185 [Pandoravirus dulcis]